MENLLKKLFLRLPFFLAVMIAMSSFFISCKDIYPYDNEEPEWLGESVYDYLESKGTFTYFVKIVNELDYKEVLAKTGSKTVFVADDAAFERFFKDNPWGVTSYEKMSVNQKRILLNYCTLNNSYLIETLSNYYDGTLQEGSAMRRTTAVTVLDTIPFVPGNKMPVTTYWDKYRTKGMYLLKDNSGWPLVHLLQDVLDFNGITNEDFRIMTGIERQNNDAHIFGIKIKERDIACKNGYVNVLEEVLIPPVNMAEYIRTTPDLSLFSTLLDRFCAPFYDSKNTIDYKKNNSAFTDSIFTLKYFAEPGGSLGGSLVYPNGARVSEDLRLPFDPGMNSYVYRYGSLQSDMGAIFAPTNEALEEYFNNGSGRVLKERYGSWENVPNDILALLLTRHMRESVVNSLPSNFHKMVDKKGSRVKASPSDILNEKNYIGLNGLVYVTNKIYPPDDYVSVYGPVLFSNKTTVLTWGIKKYLYHLYLNSMVNSYAFVAPTDEALKCYIDPLTWGSNTPTALKFWYDPLALQVKATVYNYDKATRTVGDSVTVVANADFIKSRLVRILDQSIVVSDFKNSAGNFNDGYYVTKDGNILKANKISGIAGQNSSSITTFQGGDDIENGKENHVIEGGIYHQDNGTTFFTDQICQTPFQSVYSVLSDSIKYPSFSKFFKLCYGFPNNEVFIRESPNWGIDFNVRFFNTFRYTVYVPTNEAIQKAIDEGVIYDWDQITAERSDAKRDSMINKMERFVRYHFQDNSVFIHPSQPVNQLYQTATIKLNGGYSYFNTYKNKFYRILVKNNAEGGLDLTTELGKTIKVDPNKHPNTCNIMTRDYIFSVNPTSLTSLSATTYTQSEITTSSTAVIHQIDEVLRFE